MRLDAWIWTAAAAASLAVVCAVAARGASPAKPAARAAHDPPAKSVAHDVKITILSTMLAEPGIGEWGFSALVEVDGHLILFDTGHFPETVSKNANTLDFDLSVVPDVVLSHHHGDHTGGLLTLRDEARARNPKALARAHVGKGFFWSRRSGGRDREANSMIAARPKYERSGGVFNEYAAPVELFPGVWLTGPVPRVHDEKNFGRGVRVDRGGAWTEDDLPEDQSLVIDTPKGLVVLSGCGHAGVVNTLEYARKVVRNAHVHAAIGGFHLYQNTEEALAWTGSELRSMGVENFFGAHCTGLEATYRMRELLDLPRERCEVAAVGGSFSLESGIDPLTLAK